jgi:NAD(P)-dependent dehydrogenase (short-subunit alcohol dehydrogenase family)
MSVDAYRLDGKRMLVTGAARGIGRAVALAASRAGARVYGTDTRADELDETRRLLGDDAGHAVGAFDLRAAGEISRLCGDAARALGGLDSLACVAGVIVRRGDLDEVTEDDWDLQYAVNLKAVFFLNREAARLMRGPGSIVNFSSQGWWTGGYGGSVAYSATKAGVVALTRGLARTLAPRGIRVNAIAPGAVDTAMMNEGLDEGARESFLRQVPLGRMSRPEEQAHAAVFLASDASGYITGTTLNVSGGQLVY